MKKLFAFLAAALMCVTAVNATTVKAKMPADWGTTISVWSWGGEEADGWKTATLDGNWYVYTTTSTNFSMIFVNGTDWTGDANQTVDIAISGDVCLQIGEGTGKRAATVVDCTSGEATEPVLGAGYGIMVNDETYIAGTKNTGYSGEGEEYHVSATLNAGDRFQIFNSSTNTGWAMPVDAAGYQFEIVDEHYAVTETGSYDLYIKLIYEHDNMYVAFNGAGGGGQGGGQTGKLYYYLKESGMGSPSADELFENGVLANYDLKATDVSGKAYIFLIISNTEGSAIGQQYMTKAYVDGGTSAQFFPDGVSQYEKWGLQPGTYTFYLYKDEGDSYTMSTELIPGRTLVDADQTALDEVAVKAPAQKIIRNGEILIQVGDKFFNALGTEVK